MLGEINKNYLLQVKKLSKVFEIRDAALRKRTIKAVDGVSFVINNKETFAIVGESGSGKSTIGRILLGLTDKTAGEIFFDGNHCKFKIIKILFLCEEDYKLFFKTLPHLLILG